MTTFVDRLHKPFYSGDFYREDAVRGRGAGFLLLGILVLFQVTVLYAVARPFVNEAFNQHIPYVIDQMPTVTFSNGEISIDKPEPHHVVLFEMSNSETGLNERAVLVFEDRQDSMNNIRDWMIANDVVVLVTHTGIIARTDRNGELRSFDMRDYKENSVLTRETMSQIAQKFRAWVWPVVIAFMIPVLWIYKIFQALFFSLFGVLFNKLRKTNLNYQVLLRFSSYALWCATIIAGAIQLIGVTLPGILFFLILLAFLYSAVDFVKKGQKGLPPRSY
jgi:hypothetical protein